LISAFAKVTATVHGSGRMVRLTSSAANHQTPMKAAAA
jgi:hypothetical protein